MITITPYEEWDMYTPQGDRSIKKKAQGLIDRLNKATTRSQMYKAFKIFFKSYRRMAYTKTMSEAGDTAVREVVWDFAEKIRKELDRFPETLMQKVWDEAHTEACNEKRRTIQ